MPFAYDGVCRGVMNAVAESHFRGEDDRRERFVRITGRMMKSPPPPGEKPGVGGKKAWPVTEAFASAIAELVIGALDDRRPPNSFGPR
jgi:hypothetical protein